MEMLADGMFVPQRLEDGTFVFAAPIDQGFIPMIALDDFAYYVNWIFSNPQKSAGIELAVATEDVTYDELVKTFVEVTGKKAIFANLSEEQYFVYSYGTYLIVESL